MKPNVYLYILVMAGVTYLIRMLPLVLFKREITSPFVKSFLYLSLIHIYQQSVWIHAY